MVANRASLTVANGYQVRTGRHAVTEILNEAGPRRADCVRIAPSLEHA